MAIHVRFGARSRCSAGSARLMNDPRHFDSVRDVRELLDQGYLRFVLDWAASARPGRRCSACSRP